MGRRRSLRPTLALGGALAGLLGLPGCARDDAARPVQTAPLSVPAPADHGDLCLDVGEVRACWDAARRDGACLEGRCLLARPDAPPAFAAEALRCAGQGSARACDERQRHASPFVCQGDACSQERARTPDDAEWECAELDGAMVCRRVAAAAGIPDGETDPAFVCGVRAGSDERVCVDLAPDRPPMAGPLRCMTQYAGGVRHRSCARASRPGLGDACSAEAACPRDALCVSGHCLPPRPAPRCWLDADCGAGGRCRWGSCVGGA